MVETSVVAGWKEGRYVGYRLISQLSHVEIFTPDIEQTLWFYKDLLGLQESARSGQSVYLRAWGEYFHHSLKVTEGPAAGLGHMAWRTDGAQELEDAAAALQTAGVEGEWIDGDTGHGRAFQWLQPGGHRAEIVWDCERYVAPEGERSVYPNRPQKQVAHNAAVRRIDHVTVRSRDVTADRKVFTEALGFRHMEGIALPTGVEVTAFLSSGASDHDFALGTELPDYTGPGGRMDHVCWFYDTRDELLRACDVLAEHGQLLTWGPHRHGVGETFFAYLFEPGGNRIELQTGGYWNYIPDWEPVIWTAGQRPNHAWWETQLPAAGTPPPDPLSRFPSDDDVANAQVRAGARTSDS